EPLQQVVEHPEAEAPGPWERVDLLRDEAGDADGAFDGGGDDLGVVRRTEIVGRSIFTTEAQRGRGAIARGRVGQACSLPGTRSRLLGRVRALRRRTTLPGRLQTCPTRG